MMDQQQESPTLVSDSWLKNLWLTHSTARFIDFTFVSRTKIEGQGKVSRASSILKKKPLPKHFRATHAIVDY